MDVFKTTVAYLNDVIPNINEETFSNRLKTLKRMQNLFKQTEGEVRSSLDFRTAAQRVDLNMRSMGFVLDPNFRINVSFGEELLRHIQTETGREGVNVQESLARISFNELINTTTHHTKRYTRLFNLFEELQYDERSPHTRRADNLEDIVDLLHKQNTTLNSALARTTSQDSSSEESNSSPILNQVPFPGSKLFTNTPYKVHLKNNPDCFLTTFNFTFEKSYCEKVPGTDEQPIPYVACSADDKKIFYNQPEATWFIKKDPNSYTLLNLKKKKLGFPTIWVRPCKLNNSTVVQYIYMTNGDGGGMDVFVKGHRSAYLSSHWSNGDELIPQKYDWMGRAKMLPGPGIKPTFRLTPAIQLAAKLSKFEFQKPDPFESSKKDFADSFEIANNGPTIVKRTIKLEEKVTDTYSFGFTEDFSFCSKVSTEVSLEASVSAKVSIGVTEGESKVTAKATVAAEISTELNKGSHQDWTKSTEKSIIMEYELTVPEYTTAHISAWYQKVDDIEMSFSTTIQFSGNMSRITKYNEVIEGTAASGGDIYEYLVTSGNMKPPGAELIRINDYSVDYKLKGVMKASMGLLGQIGVTSSHLEHP